VSVTVVNPDAQSAVASGAFTYLRLMEREQSDSTGWWWYYGVSAAQVSQELTTNNARLVDISVENVTAGVPSFSVIMVSNSGAYSTSWDWYYGYTEADLNTQLSATNSRPISLSPYWDGTSLLFAAVTVDNTGNNYLGYWWYYGTNSYVTTAIGALTNARVVDFENFDNNGTTNYFAIAIPNTGVEAANWYWFYNISPATLGTDISTDNAQVLTFIGDSGGNYDVTLRSPPSAAWWYYYNVTPAQAFQYASTNNARLTSARVDPSSLGGTYTYDVVMIQN